MTPLTFVRGDTWRLNWQLQDEAGAPIPLDGCTAAMQVRDTDDALILDCGPHLLVDTDLQQIQLTVPAATTAELAPARHAYDLQITWANGHVQTLDYGPLIIAKDITRP